MISDISQITSKSEYGVFNAPFKMLWSNQHGCFVVAGQNCLYLFNLTTHDSEVKYALDGFENTDFDVSSDGLTAVASASSDGLSSIVKVMGLNLFDVKAHVVVSGVEINKVGFIPQGNLVFTSEQIGESKTNFNLLDVNTGGVSSLATGINGSAVSMISDSLNKCMLAVMSNGQVIKATQTQAVSIGTIGDGVLIANGGIVEMDAGTVAQTKVRVFVGSRQWSNDRWDSGEMETSKTSILYGGGDNLEPGQKYWVNITTYHDGSGWSAPFEKEFVVPIS